MVTSQTTETKANLTPKNGRPDLYVLEQDIYSALERVGEAEFLSLLAELGKEMPRYLDSHLSNEHSLPSPSSLTNCRTQLYWKGKDVEPDEGKVIPAAWRKRAVAGSILEPFWFTVLSMAGLDVQLPQKGIPCGPHMVGSPDALIGDDGLLELKDLTGWTYKRLIEGEGVAFEEPKYYTQTQLYLYATGREWCLFFASTPDPAFFQSILRRYKKYGQAWVAPLMYMEIIDRREADIQAALARAEMIVEDQDSDEPPPREYDGRATWPCAYCPTQKRCNDYFT